MNGKILCTIFSRNSYSRHWTPVNLRNLTWKLRKKFFSRRQRSAAVGGRLLNQCRMAPTMASSRQKLHDHDRKQLSYMTVKSNFKNYWLVKFAMPFLSSRRHGRRRHPPEPFAIERRINVGIKYLKKSFLDYSDRRPSADAYYTSVVWHQQWRPSGKKVTIVIEIK